MDYVIKNKKNVYIKLNENGRPVTCPENVKGIFEYSKAKNIANCLPKTLQRMGFQVEPLPEIDTKQEREIPKERATIQKDDYVLSENIVHWVDKFGVCADILNQAKQREEQLIKELEKSDKELLDFLHIIEIEKPKDLFNGWKIYKSIKANREKRREIKDEILIVENVLGRIDSSCLQRERVQKAVDGLLNRKYTFRIVEEELQEA